MQIQFVGKLSDMSKAAPTALWTLLYMDKGKGRVRAGDAVYQVEEGEAFFALPGFSVEKVGDWKDVRGCFLYFSGGDAIAAENCVLYPDAVGQKLLRENAVEKGDALFLHLREEPEESEKVVLRKLRAYIRENLHTPLSLQKAADALGIRPANLSKLCREAFGCGFGTYVAERRLEHARHLLKNQTLTISEIAVRLGYSSSQYFSIVFKKETGLSPSDYRKYAI